MGAEKRRDFAAQPYLPILALLGCAVLFWIMDALDRTWGPNDLWYELFFVPVKPIDLLFRPFRNFLVANRAAWGGDFHAAWFFGMFCYSLAGALYPVSWSLIRGRGSRWSALPFALTAALFAAQLALGYGWDSYAGPA